MLQITPRIRIPENEISFQAIRAQGAGGQHVNKVSTAVQLFFDIPSSSLPEPCKERLLGMSDSRISREGTIVIKCQEFRSQERNRQAAMDRLVELVRRAAIPPRKRKRTRPTRASRAKRLEDKARMARNKVYRRRVEPPE